MFKTGINLLPRQQVNPCLEHLLVGGEGEEERGRRRENYHFILRTNSKCSRQGLTCCLGNTLYRRDMNNILVLPW